MKAVTLIIPIRNRTEFLPRLFCSLEQITYEALEVFLVDNGSTDDSYEKCCVFSRESKHRVTVWQESHPGACAARNCGLRHCQTEWVYFFDSDDEFTSDFLDVLMPLAEETDMVCFPTSMDQDGVLRQRNFVSSSSVRKQIISSTLNTQGMLLRTSFLRDVGGWNETLRVWQDWELGVRLLLRHPRVMWCGTRAFHVLHQHTGGITYTTGARERRHALDVVNQLLVTEAQRRILYFRSEIWNGLAQRSGDQISFPCPFSAWVRWVGWLLRIYTRLGGKGAWRIVLCFI